MSDVQKLLLDALDLVCNVVFGSGTVPSLEKLFQEFRDICDEFSINRDQLHNVIQKLIDMMPKTVDKIMEFLIKHVLPALSVCYKDAAFALVRRFLHESFEQLLKEGTVRARCFATSLATYIVKGKATTAKEAAETVVSNGSVAGREVTKKAAKKTAKSTLTETAEGLTATTTTKVGMKNAAKAGLAAAGISAAVGGVFLYRDLNDLDKQMKKKKINEIEYKEQKAQRVGEFAGDVIGTGVAGFCISLAALSGPAGWAAIGVGALFSFATGKVGGQIAKELACQ